MKVWQGVAVLAYHRIGDGADSNYDRGLWSASAEDFAAQIRFLKKHFDIISPADLAGVLAKGRGRHAMITFDDGYRDNYEVALPILRAYDIRATFFVATGYIDQPRLTWWDEIAWMVRNSPCTGVAAGTWLASDIGYDEPHRERAIRLLLRRYKDLPGEQTAGYLAYLAEATASGRHPPADQTAWWMTWDMVRELHAAGMTIGGHTINHPILSRLPAEEQAREIGGGKDRLEEELGASVVRFSYPVGGRQAFNADTRACLRGLNITWAFNYGGGPLRFGDWDPYAIPRFAVESEDCRAAFRAALTWPQRFAQ